MPTGPLTPPPPSSRSCGGRHTQTGEVITPTARGRVPAPPLPLRPWAAAPRGLGEGREGASPPRSRVAWERNPVAVATVSKRTGGGSRPALAPSLTGALPLPPSLPPSGVGWGRGWPGRGSEAATRGQSSELPAGRDSARDHLLPALRARPARRRRRGTHGPRHPPRARPPGSGRVVPAPRTEPPAWGRRRRRPRVADCGSEGGCERWARASGRARARTRRVPARRARARGRRRGAPTPSLSPARRLSWEPKAEDLAPTCRAEIQARRLTRGALGSPCTGKARATPHRSWQQAVRNGRTQADRVYTIGRAHRMLSQAADTHIQLNPESTHKSRHRPHPEMHSTHVVGKSWSRQVTPMLFQLTKAWPLPTHGPSQCVFSEHTSPLLLRSGTGRRPSAGSIALGFMDPAHTQGTEVSPSESHLSVRHHTDSIEPAWNSLPFSLPLPCARALSLSLKNN